jgi:hypothetical protein
MRNFLLHISRGCFVFIERGTHANRPEELHSQITYIFDIILSYDVATLVLYFVNYFERLS